MPSVSLDPYLFFTGNCAEAMAFYKEVFGGELTVANNEDGTVMHADLHGGLVKLLASDGTRRTPYEVSNITLSLSGTDERTLTSLFDALSEDGEVTAALKTEAWGDTFGTLTDQFGIDWMVNISAS